jgi:hypothetical protein
MADRRLQPPANPVDIVTGIQRDLAKFRKIYGKQESGPTIRELLRDALLQAAKENVLASMRSSPHSNPVVEHFLQQEEQDPVATGSEFINTVWQKDSGL